MPISKEQAIGLYQRREEAAPQKPAYQLSNRDLLKRLGTNYFAMAAETFMRPRMAIKYHLLPALAWELEAARPHPGAGEKLSREIELARSLALLLQTADPAWKELPKSWVFLGSSLEGRVDYDSARDLLNDIFSDIATVAEPMKFLRRFCQPLPERSRWLRFYDFTNGEMDNFMDEKRLSIEMIQADEGEDA